MKKLLITLTGAFAFSASHLVFAGPDWQLIEQARKAKTDRMQVQCVAAAAQARRGDSTAIMLPHEHWPRAQPIPSSNQQDSLGTEQRNAEPTTGK